MTETNPVEPENEPVDAPEAEDTAQEAAEAPEGALEDAEDAEDGGKPGNREAAKWRTKLREAEAERDALAARLEDMQRTQVTRLAEQSLAVGSDVFEVARADLSDLLDESGEVDPEKVSAVTEALITDRPQLARRRFTGSADGGARGTLEAPSNPFHDAAAVIQGNRR